jgi:hypothetical protein
MDLLKASKELVVLSLDLAGRFSYSYSSSNLKTEYEYEQEYEYEASSYIL